MKKALASLALILGGSLVAFGFATPAQAYPDFGFSASVSKQTVKAHATFTSTSSASIQCKWGHTFNGRTQTHNGTSFTATWRAPGVKKPTVYPVRFTCTYTVPSSGRVAPMAQVWHHTIDVTVVPVVAPGHSGQTGGQTALPNTGGPSSAVLGGGLLLLLLGVIAAWTARRRAERVDATR